MDPVLLAFLITLGAGLATGIGSIIAFYAKETNHTFLSAALGFSAGVMIYVSFVEIFAKANDSLIDAYGSEAKGTIATVIAFFVGMGIIALIDNLVPSEENPHEIRGVEDLNTPEAQKSLLRMGVFSAIAIAIHNFPEGIATFMGAIQDPALGIGIGVAIAIHNIPEGIAVSVPIRFATGSKRKAFCYSFLSGLAEPVGAVAGYFILRAFLNDAMFGIVFAGVAGIMVYISLDELLPTAEKYGKHHVAIIGVFSGMVVMALSLLLFM